MIKFLTLKNFRKHAHLHLDFTSGLNLVQGPNWAGKSSALSGIPFALFGVRAVPWPMASLVSLGETDMEVALGFSHAGQDYKVVRSVKSATLAQGDKVVATGHSAVTAEIESIIGCSMRDFLDFQSTSQGEADALLDSNSTKLAGFVARATGVDVVDAVTERIKGEQTLCRGALQALPETSFDIGRLTAARTTYDEALQAAKAAEEASVRTGTDHQEAARLFADLQAAHAAATQSRNQRAVAEGVKANAEQRLAEATSKRISKPTTDLASRRVEIAELSAQALLAKTQRETLTAKRTDLATADRSIEQFEGLLSSRTEIDLGPLVARHDAAREAYRSLEVQVALAEKALEESACPYCNRPFEPHDPAALEQQLLTVRNAQLAAEFELGQAEDALDAARAKNTETRGLSGSLENWKVYRGQLADAITALEADLVEPVESGRLDELTDACTRLEAAWKAYESGEANYESARANLTRASEALDNCEIVEGPTEDVLTRSQNMAQTASEAAWQALHDTRAATGTRDAAKAALERLEAEQADSKEAAARRQYFLDREAGLTELGKYLRANRDRYTSAFWSQLLSYAGTLISEATSGEVTRLTRNVAGEFLYYEGGRELTVSGYASGMQRAIFSTAIKLSLAAAVGTPFRVMLFDEITAAAGDEVSLQFTSLLASAGKQVICVTHRAADAAAADHVIELG